MSVAAAFIVIVWLSLVVSFLTARFLKYIMSAFMFLVAVFILGIFALFFDTKVAEKMIGYSLGLIISGLLLHVIAAVVSVVFLTPLGLLWAAIRNLFNK